MADQDQCIAVFDLKYGALANNIFIAASHNLVLVRDIDAGHISLVFALYLFTSYKLMSLRRIRQAKEGNSALPARRYEP